MTINEAIQKRIARLHLPMWANPQAYILLHLVGNDSCGPWAKLFDRPFQEETPEQFLCIGDNRDDFVPYDGPLDRDDTGKEGEM